MGDDGIFFVSNTDAGEYERSVRGRAHFFRLGMARGNPGWLRGGEALGAARKAKALQAAGIYYRRCA